MKRFFSTSRAALRVPPKAPSRVKEVPIPRTVRTTAEINQIVEERPGPAAATARPLSAAYAAEMFPEPSAGIQLRDPEGVWYSVARSRSGNLPVYTDYNNAGHVWTEVRKISGNVGALRNDIKKSLGIAKNDIWVKNAAQTIVIKGDWSRRVKSLLAEAF